MSEEKLYAVKTDEGEFLSFSDDGDSVWNKAVGHFETDKQKARSWAYNRGGHVVTLIEEPKKVVISKEQAQVVKEAHDAIWPAKYITDHTDVSNGVEKLLMNAYVNGYTVAKEKKYNVKVPHAEGWHFQKYSRESKRGSRNDWKPFPAKDIDSNMSKDLFLFTEAEIEHYGLQDCKKEEVTDDAD
ncbi:DUF1642 domain-containing protein [Lacticaseibacillus paracasei]|uniref:DUF1642 domain-containing protein n=1 Tax=Lacticaseibacillus paracasei TaxID=1597 RepID=A0ABD5D001_LACPA|nr:DUF1642 domain-containing protein [Lacticaseibacillus paracasei]MDR7624991.1 DUF1642 domain-containing protein [Lacticaseibacillus paracasei]QPC13391.1 DUF1642 domain-containing protein [Lacticaseibacillus paracasei subsp. tolerans]QUS98673.1 DUF1642 domain-containing protein [Lacticaseibacillus paracasei subsp. tolerans]WMX60499.1 DUF1642 domain-containing protein [Lacticaseibacillus paracasei]